MENDDEDQFLKLVDNFVFKTDTECKLKKMMEKEIEFKDPIPSFPLPLNWRFEICKCPDCLEMYKQLGIEFITDPRDMLFVFNQKNRKSYDDKLSVNTNTHQNYLLIERYNKFKNVLKKYLSKWENEDKSVSVADIEEFSNELFRKKDLKF